VHFLLFIAFLPALAETDWSERAPHSFEKGLQTIQLTAIGRKIVSPLLPLLEKKQLKLETLTGPAARRLGLGPDSAGGVYEDTVYLDNDVPLVAFAATLLHELVHATEYHIEKEGAERRETLAAYVKDPASHRDAAMRIIVRGERRAYAAQDAFLNELIAHDPDSKGAIASSVDHRYLISFPVSEAQLRVLLTHESSFGFPTRQVDEYLKQ